MTKKILYKIKLFFTLIKLIFLSLKKNNKIHPIYILNVFFLILSNRYFDLREYFIKNYSLRRFVFNQIKKNYYTINNVSYWSNFKVKIKIDKKIKNFDQIILADIYEIFYEKIYSKYFLEENANYNNIFDCGANIGLFSLYASNNFKINKLHAFEASAQIFDVLFQNVNLNNLNKNIIIKNDYLHSYEKKIKFLFDKDIFTMSKISNSDLGYSVNATTLDSYIIKNRINDIDLIKMDIEGSEIEVLKGSNFILNNLKPDLIISAYHSPDQLVDIISYLSKLKTNYIISVPRNELAHPIVYASINPKKIK